MQELELLRVTDTNFNNKHVAHEEGSYGRVYKVPLEHAGSENEGLLVRYIPLLLNFSFKRFSTVTGFREEVYDQT